MQIVIEIDSVKDVPLALDEVKESVVDGITEGDRANFSWEVKEDE